MEKEVPSQKGSYGQDSQSAFRNRDWHHSGQEQEVVSGPVVRNRKERLTF